MKKFLTYAILSCSFALTAEAQVGEPFIHDPSTIQECDGKYYTFGTGGGGLISSDDRDTNLSPCKPANNSS